MWVSDQCTLVKEKLSGGLVILNLVWSMAAVMLNKLERLRLGGDTTKLRYFVDSFTPQAALS